MIGEEFSNNTMYNSCSQYIYNLVGGTRPHRDISVTWYKLLLLCGLTFFTLFATQLLIIFQFTSHICEAFFPHQTELTKILVIYTCLGAHVWGCVRPGGPSGKYILSAQHSSWNTIGHSQYGYW